MDTERCILCGSYSTRKRWVDRKWEQRYQCNDCWRTFFSGQAYYSGTEFAEQTYNSHYVYGVPIELLAVYYNTTPRKISSIIRWEVKRRQLANQPYHLSSVKMYDPSSKQEILPPYLEQYGKVPLRMPDGRAVYAASLPGHNNGFHIDPTALYRQPAFNNQTTSCVRDPRVPYPEHMKKGNLPTYT